MAHGAELSDEEVIGPMVGGCVFLNLGELHKLQYQKNTQKGED